MSTKIFILSLILMLTLISVSAWNNCNNTINNSGKYTLNASLTCAGYSVNFDNYIFRINTSNVEIDCAGYTLISNHSDGLFDTYEVRGGTTTGRTNITIRNCHLIVDGATQILAIQNEYDNNFSLINNNITTNQNNARFIDIIRTTGNPMPRNVNISGNRFTLTSTSANNPFLQLSGGINCSAGISVYNNLFNLTSLGFIFNNLDNCEFAMSNATGIGNYFIDSRWNCTDNNSNGICDNPYDIFRNFTGIYATRDYYATTTYPYSCSPLWSCSGYANCTGGGNVSCNAVTDANSCLGTPAYAGNYSEFQPQNCTYNCTPNWSCSGYSSCNASNLSSCNAVTDLNTCGGSYSGNYSEFSPQACNYTVCTPLWTCSGYGMCNITDNALCNSATDLNTCNISYAGNYSEFGAQSCNYCTLQFSVYTSGLCSGGNTTIQLCNNNTNFASCCNVTHLPSDCYTNESQTSCSAIPCAKFDYTSGDLASATINGFAVAIITLVSLAGLIVLFLIGYVVFKMWKKKLR